MMVVQRRSASRRGRSSAIDAVHAATLGGGGCQCVRAGGIFRLVEKSTDVVDEERIQQIHDLLTVGKLESAIKWDPVNG